MSHPDPPQDDDISETDDAWPTKGPPQIMASTLKARMSCAANTLIVALAVLCFLSIFDGFLVFRDIRDHHRSEYLSALQYTGLRIIGFALLLVACVAALVLIRRTDKLWLRYLRVITKE